MVWSPYPGWIKDYSGLAEFERSFGTNGLIVEELVANNSGARDRQGNVNHIGRFAFRPFG